MKNKLLPAIELTSNHHPIASVIWLHGLGADGNDFVPIIKELALPDNMPVRFIFPHAPMRPVTVNGGHVMRAWYDLTMLGGNVSGGHNESNIRESQHSIEMFIEREIERGIPSEKIFLAGFSQGGVIALHTGLRYQKKLGGIIALSTYLALIDSLATERSEINRAVSIYMAHGIQDPVIPINIGTLSKNELGRLGFSVEWYEYPMQHSVCMEEIESISKWLQKRLN